MNQAMRRWIKAGALIFIATLVVAACEGPAGPTGNAGAAGAPGAPGTDGTPGLVYVAMGFSYVPYTGPGDATPHRAEGLPFGEYVAAGGEDLTATAFDDTMASVAFGQCLPLDSDGVDGAPFVAHDLYGYEAFGGSGKVTHTVSVSYGADDAKMIVYGSRPADDPPVMGVGGPGDMGNGFELSTSMVPSEMLAGRANLASGDYMWTLHASDEADQSVSRSWKFRVIETTYVPPDGANSEAEPATDEDEDIEDWADFISSTFTPAEFGVTPRTTAISHADTENVVKAVNLAADSGMGSIEGVIEENDIDAIWVGGLTPDSKLDVKYEGKLEGTTSNAFNKISVVLRRHVAGGDPQDAIMADAETTKDYMATYSNLACGFYYLEVEGVDGDMGDYELSWQYAE